MRSSLSAEEAQNQKLYFGAEIGFYFINSCILGSISRNHLIYNGDLGKI